MMKLSLIIAAILMCDVACAIVLPHHISSHMVLQRSPQTANIWGYEEPGSTVTVRHGNAIRSSVADAKGDWLVTLPPTAVMFDQTITITTSANASEIITLTDVAFGDVYLCSGQSNMELTLSIIFGGKDLIAESINYPNIRMFPIRRERDKVAFNDTKSRYGPLEPWVRAAPQYLNGSVFNFFSAVCYIYGVGLSRGLGGAIPIGLVESSFGGTKIELWTSPEGIKQCPIDETMTSQSSSIDDQYIHDTEDSDITSYSGIDDSIVYFGMISPILPMQFKAVIWYQGESNDENSTLYSCRFPAMIQDWRTQFKQPNLPFYFVLLAPSVTILNDPLLRDAQLHALTLGNVSVASAIDLGDSGSPEGSIHPRNKTILGYRLADIALYNLYGQTKLIISGPMETSPYVFRNSSQDRMVSLQLTYAVTPDTTYNDGLQLSGTAQCDSCCNVTGSPIQFLLVDSRTGMNITTIRTNIAIKGDVLTASADLKPYPTTAYVSAFAIEWDNQPECIIANTQFIPQLPSYRLLQQSSFTVRESIAQQ